MTIRGYGGDDDRAGTYRKTISLALWTGNLEDVRPLSVLIIAKRRALNLSFLAEIAPEDRQYKGKLIDKALRDMNGRRIADIPRRAGIYAYFFVHGTKFLRNGGRFGFVVSESWLDVDYGKGLQEFFLKNYKIIAIIGNKVECWFEDADINTCLIIQR
jgi:hypothetical protein